MEVILVFLVLAIVLVQIILPILTFAKVNNIVNELRSCPIPSQPVYGSQPILTCGGNQGCGCGCGGMA